MSDKKPKQTGTRKPEAISFSGPSVLLPPTRQKIENLRKALIRGKLTPWRWFESRGVSITGHDGTRISMSGCRYEGTPTTVFWGCIAPFLQDAIVNTLNETVKICRVREYDPEPYVRETAMLLEGHLIEPIYREMVGIDRAIRGKGNPKSVSRRGTYATERISDLVRFLNKCRDEMIQGNREASGSAKGMTWRDVQGKLLVMCENGEPYIKIADLAKRCGCSRSTLHKAIKGSTKLKGWQKQHARRSLKAQSINPVVMDNARSEVADPADVLTDDEVDATFARLLQEAEPEERASLNSMTQAQRRDLVRT